MPTNTNAYNSRVTDEALEKRFRDTFRSQGGAELVDDLYAQGVIVPIVDFTAAATGQQLSENLQTAWDFTTGFNSVEGATTTLISTAGFWKVDLLATWRITSGSTNDGNLFIDDGSSTKTIWQLNGPVGSNDAIILAETASFNVFLRSGDSLKALSPNPGRVINVWYRQIATVNGDLVNPSGFTSS